MRDLDDPTNVDTVPAMLTEGEFVLNKEAVQMYGPVIEQMNNAGLAARAQGNAAVMQHLNTGGVVGGLFDDDEAWKRYSSHIASIESGGYKDPYSIYGGANDHYVGKYQLGAMAIEDGARILGMKKTPTREQVRKDPALQERLFKAYTKANHGYLKNDPNFKAMSAEQQRDIIGYAHNQGAGAAKKYMRTGVAGKDAFGTSGTKYFMSDKEEPKSQAVPEAGAIQQAVESVVADNEVVDMSPSAEAGEAALMPSFEMPNIEQPQMHVPNLSMPMQAPEYIPSVTEKTMKDRQQPGHFNDGGLIGWLFGKDKEEEERKKTEVEKMRRLYREMNTIEEGAEYDPRGANQVPTPDWQMSPEGQSVKNLQRARSGDLPNIPQMPVEPEVGGFNQKAPELNNRIQMIHNRPSVPTVPAVNTAPPAPMPGRNLDADMLVGHTGGANPTIAQAINREAAAGIPKEEQLKYGPQSRGGRRGANEAAPPVAPYDMESEQLTAKQRWDRLKAQRDALPKGDPRRVELSNMMNKINVANAAVDPREGLRSGAANAVGIPEPEKVYSGRGEEGYFDEEERKYRLNEQLRQKQMQQAVTAPDAPGKAMVDAQVEALQTELDTLGVPPESQGLGTDMREPAPGERPNIGTPQRPGYNPEEMTAVPGIDTNAPDVVQQEMDKVDPDLADPRKESTEQRKSNSMLKNNPAKAGEAVKAGIDKHGETPSEELMAKPVQEVADAGAAAIAKDPGMFKNISSSLKSAFGDLFDSKELARMAVVFAGAMLTGASAGQALAYAGGMYMQRVDARANQYDKLVLSGKYTPESLKAYKDTQDLTDLVPVGVTPTLTGEFEKMYTESGKEIVVQKAKVGENTVYVDENGKQVNPYKLQNKSPEDRHTYIKTHQAAVEKQIDEMRTTFDVKDDFSSTDILPSTNSKAVVEWALDNGVDPAELGGLVESAYHEAINDRRQDGSRARSLVPYLNQLVIRQQVPGGADLFTVKPKGEDGPAQYVNASKVQKLNKAASNKLKSMGHKGGTQDLANMFYTEAAQDWNALPEAVRKQWNKRAGSDVNGFYLFVEDMLINN